MHTHHMHIRIYIYIYIYIYTHIRTDLQTNVTLEQSNVATSYVINH